MTEVMSLYEDLATLFGNVVFDRNETAQVLL
jgi:hypothetical protein